MEKSQSEKIQTKAGKVDSPNTKTGGNAFDDNAVFKSPLFNDKIAVLDQVQEVEDFIAKKVGKFIDPNNTKRNALVKIDQINDGDWQSGT